VRVFEIRVLREIPGAAGGEGRGVTGELR